VSTGAASSVASVQPRQRIRTTGRVESVRVVRTREPLPGASVRIRVECELDDGTGSVWLVFLGQYEMPGVREAACLSVDGVVIRAGDRLMILDPAYTVVPCPGDGFE
jgi:hypothetical protein